MSFRKKFKYYWRRFEPYIVMGEMVGVFIASPFIFHSYTNLDPTLASLTALMAFGLGRVIDRFTTYKTVEVNKKLIEKGVDSPSFLAKEGNPLIRGIYKDGKSFMKKSLRIVPFECIVGLTSCLYPPVGYGTFLASVLAGGNNIYRAELNKATGKKYLNLKELNPDCSAKLEEIKQKIKNSEILEIEDKKIVEEIISSELKNPLQKNAGKLMKKMLYYI